MKSLKYNYFIKFINYVIYDTWILFLKINNIYSKFNIKILKIVHVLHIIDKLNIIDIRNLI